MNFLNKTVVISGASNGIGAACAKSFFDAGANVVLLDIAVNKVAMESERWFSLICDVSCESMVIAAFDSAYERFGSLDYLINNAGIQRYGSVTETTSEEWDLVMNVNLKSLFLCSKYALPLMIKNNRGVIINVSSVQAFLSQQNVAAYTTSKSAILGLTRSIAVDYSPAIRCVAVCPGTIDTPMLRDSISLSADPELVLRECIDMHLSKRIGNAEEIADLILFLCDDKASFITGQAIRIDGGLGISVQGSKR